MSDLPRQESARPRTATRMRFVGPPGMGLGEDHEDVKTIGRYELLETLGKGAMGVVYKARDPLLDRIVAVKTIVSPRGAGKRSRRAYLERFEREAKAAAKMQHPAIVTIFDVGADRGAPYMVLEYLPGETLADRLDKVRMPLNKGVQIALDLASALGFAHKERIVHRDVKPANVLSAGDTRWKLADFGIARMPDSDLTQVGIFMGTPGYAPPEAISQGNYTPQADVFAWGAVLYELLSGRIPYEGPDTRTTNGYVLKNTARSPRVHDPSIPEPLEAICMTALDASVDVRYKNCEQAEQSLRAAWERCLSENLVGAKAFSSEEVPHERAPAQMHGAASNGSAGQRVGDAGVGDNDPTRIMQREASHGDDAPTRRDLQRRVEPQRRPEPVDPNEALMAQARFTAEKSDVTDIEALARDTALRGGGEASAEAPRLGLWIAVVVAALVAGGFAAYYLISTL